LPPSEFSKGNHSKISVLKSKLSKIKTKYYRPDLHLLNNETKAMKSFIAQRPHNK